MKDCTGCKMAEELRPLCQGIEKLLAEIRETPKEQRGEKYGFIVQELMAGGIATAMEIAGKFGMLMLFQQANNALHTGVTIMGAAELDTEKLQGNVTELLRRIFQGGEDAKALKMRSMLNQIPDDAPKH